MKQKFLQLIAALGILALAGLAAFGVTSAWISANRRVDSVKMQMQLDSGPMVIREFGVYQYSDTRKLYEPAPTEAGGNYRMYDYDSIFTDRNDHVGLFYVVELMNIPAGTKSIKATFYTNANAENSTSDIARVRYRISDRSFSETGTNAYLADSLTKVSAPAVFSGGQAALSIPLSNPAPTGVVLVILMDYDGQKVADLHLDPFSKDNTGDNWEERFEFANDLTKIAFETFS